MKVRHFVLDATADRLPDSRLQNWTHDDGTPMTPDEVRAMCRWAREQGFKVVPTCDNHDERGYCRGCEVQP